MGGHVAIKGSSFNDGTQKASVKIKGDEILYPYYDIENDKKSYKPISDDEKILCVYIMAFLAVQPLFFLSQFFGIIRS